MARYDFASDNTAPAAPEAMAALLAQAQPLTESESVETLAAHGRVLSAAVASTLDVPPMDNTSMDGYALRAADGTAKWAAATLRHMARLLEHADVLAHAGEGHVEPLGQRRDRRVGPPELLQHPAPGGIGEGAERDVVGGL